MVRSEGRYPRASYLLTPPGYYPSAWNSHPGKGFWKSRTLCAVHISLAAVIELTEFPLGVCMGKGKDLREGAKINCPIKTNLKMILIMQEMSKCSLLPPPEWIKGLALVNLAVLKGHFPFELSICMEVTEFLAQKSPSFLKFIIYTGFYITQRLANFSCKAK